ncbi:MAG: carbon-nitrogen hydrolase family protein [Bacillota bacterium]|nr:carbon-nitrogen hydrolase family protein [Bacillota bacterium]
MKVCLAAVEQREDISYGISQIRHYAEKASQEGAELILFPEAFLQGFEGLIFDYQKDIQVTIGQRGSEMAEIRNIAKTNRIAIGLGYFEMHEGSIFSSYILITPNGDTAANYRRRSIGWKESFVNADYREGKEFVRFKLKDRTFGIVLCGDFWTDDFLDEISALDCDCLLWPVYLDFSTEDWETTEYADYLERSAIMGIPVALVNAYVEDENRANGGAFVALHGKAICELKMGQPNLLYFTL